MYRDHKLPAAIRDHKGYVVMYPEGEIGKSPIVIARWGWRLRPNFVYVKDTEGETVIRVKSTRQIIKIPDALASSITYFVYASPRIFVNTLVSKVMEITEEQIAGFESDTQFMLVMWEVFLDIAFFINSVPSFILRCQ